MITSKQKEKKFNDFYLIISFLLFCMGLIMYILSEKDSILQFIGGCLIQMGISFVIIDLIISKMGQKIFRQQIRSDLREEMIALVKKYPYKVISMKIKQKMKLSSNQEKEYNLDIIEDTEIKIIALEDNSHYRFKRLSTNVGEKLNFKVFLNEILLDNKRDIRECGDGIYQITQRLKKDQEYRIRIILTQKNIMSDLENEKIDEDFIVQEFIELTDYLDSEITFPADLDKYQFFIKRIDSCGRISFLEAEVKRKKIIIEQENLHDGDKIEIRYKRKDRI